jgi:hypothetical protein
MVAIIAAIVAFLTVHRRMVYQVRVCLRHEHRVGLIHRVRGEMAVLDRSKREARCIGKCQ